MSEHVLGKLFDFATILVIMYVVCRIAAEVIDFLKKEKR